MSETEQCIRCDEPVPVGPDSLSEYRSLTFNHETGAFPLCNDCFETVADRDLWAR